MRIAQVSPLAESVPPRTYGGTERIVHYLTEELVRQGHDVTLYASGDATTSARLVALRERALRLDPDGGDELTEQLLEVERVFTDADAYDLVHFHLDTVHLPLMRRSRTPWITTTHGRMDLPQYRRLFAEFREAALVSISDAQRAPLPWLNWRATVPHGLPLDTIEARAEPGGYLAFLGRICPEKRVDRAIEIARATGIPLKVAAKVDAVDAAYFAAEIEPLLGGDGVEFVGEIGEDGKDEFLGNAAALLFPIDWPEPFGLVMIEAMARGTPVLAFRCGSVPEVIEPGVSGAVVESVAEAIAVLPEVVALDRRLVRAADERRFSARAMAAAYVDVYERSIAEQAGLESSPSNVTSLHEFAAAGQPWSRGGPALADRSLPELAPTKLEDDAVPL